MSNHLYKCDSESFEKDMIMRAYGGYIGDDMAHEKLKYCDDLEAV